MPTLSSRTSALLEARNSRSSWRRPTRHPPVRTARAQRAARGSGRLGAHHGYEADAVARGAPEVLGEGQPAVRGGDLAGPGLSAQLEPALVDHPQPAGPDRMAEALQAPVGVHGQLAVSVVDPVQDVPPGVTALSEAEVFHQDDLGRGEAVVYFGEGELSARVGDAGLRVGLPRAVDDLGEAGVVVPGVRRAGAVPGD